MSVFVFTLCMLTHSGQFLFNVSFDYLILISLRKNWVNLTHSMGLPLVLKHTYIEESIDSLIHKWVIETLMLGQQDSQCESSQ